MGVRRIFYWGLIFLCGDPKHFPRGEGGTVMKFHFSSSKLRGKHFSTEKLMGEYQILKSRGARHPISTPMLERWLQ